VGFIYIVIILFVQGPLRINDGCGKTINAGTMDQGSTVHNYFIVLLILLETQVDAWKFL